MLATTGSNDSHSDNPSQIRMEHSLFLHNIHVLIHTRTHTHKHMCVHMHMHTLHPYAHTGMDQPLPGTELGNAKDEESKGGVQ